MAIPFWLQNVLGNSLRAGLIAAGSPTPGAVGTIRDAVGGLQAAEADQQQRFDRAEAMRRAALQEERVAEKMQMEREAHQAELKWRQAQADTAAYQLEKAKKPAASPEEERLYDFYFQKAKAAGVDNEMAHRQAMAGIGRNTTGWMPPVRSAEQSEPKTPQQVAAHRLAQIERYQSEPELDPTGDREKEDWGFIERLNRANDPAPKPTAPRAPATAEAALVGPIHQRITDLEKLGTPQAMAQAEQLRGELRKIMASKKANKGGKTAVVQDTEGNFHVIDAGSPGPTRIKGNPKNAGGKDASAMINAWLNGGDAPAPSPSASQPPKEALFSLKEGVVTTFANGQKWTLKGGKPTQVK